MKSFIGFLTEKSEAPGIQHIEHPADRIFDGKDAAKHALSTVSNVANKRGDISRKLDDRMSFQVVKTADGKVGVKYKGAGAHYNFSEKDVVDQHNHKPYLVGPLTSILKHIKKVLPDRAGEWQGGFMSTPETRDDSGGVISHQPNTIKYSVPANSTEGKKLKRSKLSIAIHSELKGPNKKAEPVTDTSEFKQHPDVHIHSHVVEPKEKNIEGTRRGLIIGHIKAARQSMKDMPYEHLAGHEQTSRQYINSAGSNLERPNSTGYIKYLKAWHQKKIDSVKTQKSKDDKAASRDAAINHIKKNKAAFDQTFNSHHHLQQATNLLARALGRSATGGFDHEINGERTGPEGFVSNGLKIVDRAGFSAANRARGEALKAKRIENLSNANESFIRFGRYLSEAKELSHHITFGRMNPVTKGHQAVVDQVTKDAGSEGAGHTIILTKSQDDKKNPLTPEQKLKHVKRAFPDASVEVASNETPTILHHASKLHDAGVRNLTVHVGSDRVQEFHNLLHRYNGEKAKHGYYKFKRITVKAVGGPRTDTGDSTESASGTAMRKFVQANDREGFRKMAPKSMSDKHKDDMFNDVRKGLKLGD